MRLFCFLLQGDKNNLNHKIPFDWRKSSVGNIQKIKEPHRNWVDFRIGNT